MIKGNLRKIHKMKQKIVKNQIIPKLVARNSFKAQRFHSGNNRQAPMNNKNARLTITINDIAYDNSTIVKFSVVPSYTLRNNNIAIIPAGRNRILSEITAAQKMVNTPIIIKGRIFFNTRRMFIIDLPGNLPIYTIARILG
jgi:hypothetical protein